MCARVHFWAALLSSCGLSVCMYVVCHILCPAKAIGWNKMPFGNNVRVVPCNTVLDRGPGLPRKGEI